MTSALGFGDEAEVKSNGADEKTIARIPEMRYKKKKETAMVTDIVVGGDGMKEGDDDDNVDNNTINPAPDGATIASSDTKATRPSVFSKLFTRPLHRTPSKVSPRPSNDESSSSHPSKFRILSRFRDIQAAPHIPELELADEDAMCVICLAMYEEGEVVKRLWCGHHFHIKCVTDWLHLNKTCPLCVRDVDEMDPAHPHVDGAEDNV
ncbi:hypothetical protein HK104_003921 [Borealophlyctis nickersoniae]|nr:hypothetical protein HK104_003921 [Borealophlyctis nickersoniae]